MIQIGATDDAAKANALLTRARDRNRSTLASAKPVTEKVRKGDDTFYRARFAGLDSASAESACRSLQTQRILLLRRPRLTHELRPVRRRHRGAPLALSLHQNILGLIDPRGKSGRAAMIWMKLLHQGSVGADDFLARSRPSAGPGLRTPPGASSRRRRAPPPLDA